MFNLWVFDVCVSSSSHPSLPNLNSFKLIHSRLLLRRHSKVMPREWKAFSFLFWNPRRIYQSRYAYQVDSFVKVAKILTCHTYNYCNASWRLSFVIKATSWKYSWKFALHTVTDLEFGLWTMAEVFEHVELWWRQINSFFSPNRAGCSCMTRPRFNSNGTAIQGLIWKQCVACRNKHANRQKHPHKS